VVGEPLFTVASFVGVKVRVPPPVEPPLGVVTEVLAFADSLPAASTADTWYVYEVLAATVESV
jgi:hypothetical protein